VAERAERFKQLQRQVQNYHSRLGVAIAQAEVSPPSLTSTSGGGENSHGVGNNAGGGVGDGQNESSIDDVSVQIQKLSFREGASDEAATALSSAMSRVDLRDPASRLAPSSVA
jgi:hypothetical protein